MRPKKRLTYQRGAREQREAPARRQTCQERPIHIKRDLQTRPKETHTPKRYPRATRAQSFCDTRRLHKTPIPFQKRPIHIKRDPQMRPKEIYTSKRCLQVMSKRDLYTSKETCKWDQKRLTHHRGAREQHEPSHFLTLDAYIKQLSHSKRDLCTSKETHKWDQKRLTHHRGAREQHEPSLFVTLEAYTRPNEFPKT